jgi:hypothetical protein
LIYRNIVLPFVFYGCGTWSLGDSGVDGKIIIRLILKKWGVRVWTGSSWLREGAVGRHL